jgi:hypothetical protein
MAKAHTNMPQAITIQDNTNSTLSTATAGWFLSTEMSIMAFGSAMSSAVKDAIFSTKPKHSMESLDRESSFRSSKLSTK